MEVVMLPACELASLASLFLGRLPQHYLFIPLTFWYTPLYDDILPSNVLMSLQTMLNFQNIKVYMFDLNVVSLAILLLVFCLITCCHWLIECTSYRP